MVPAWLHDLSIISLGVGAICAAVLAIDETRHPQSMRIMYVVWPTTALFGGLFWLWGYFRCFRQPGHARRHALKPRTALGRKKQFALSVAEGATHCGSGCVLGDLLAEWLAFAIPGVLVWVGWHTLFTQSMYAVWVLDFLFAYLIGIAFQYFAIAPMRGLTLVPGLLAAVKADTLSLTAWQIGMYGFMAVAQHGIFHAWLRADLPVNSVEYWFMMQIAMLAGFCTSYPVNWWLMRAGIKEPMQR